MNTELMTSIVLSSIIRMPAHSKRQLVSTVQQRREKAEDALAASVVVELSRRS
jgi:hypothetical protein